MPETPLTPEQIAQAKAKAAAEGFLRRDAVAIDQAANAIFFHGQNDETISAHAGRDAKKGKLWGRLMVKFLNLFQKNHAAKAEAGDLQRAQAAEEVETKALATEDQALGVKK